MWNVVDGIVGDTNYGSSGDFMVNEWEMMIQRELMRFYGDFMGLF